MSNPYAFSLLSTLVESRKIVSLSASPGAAVVLLMVPETRCCVLTLRDKLPLGTEVALSVVLTSVVLEGKFVRLNGAMAIGSHGVRVALLSSYVRVVDPVEGAGEGARGAGVLGHLRHLRCVTVHDTD